MCQALSQVLGIHFLIQCYETDSRIIILISQMKEWDLDFAEVSQQANDRAGFRMCIAIFQNIEVILFLIEKTKQINRNLFQPGVSNWNEFRCSFTLDAELWDIPCTPSTPIGVWLLLPQTCFASLLGDPRGVTLTPTWSHPLSRLLLVSSSSLINLLILTVLLEKIPWLFADAWKPSWLGTQGPAVYSLCGIPSLAGTVLLWKLSSGSN